MSKIIPTKISKTERAKLKKILAGKLIKFNSTSQMSNFLEDLLTESELVMIYRRLQIARMLIDEKLYWEIRKELGVSHDTIKSIRQKLDRSKGGYLNFIKGLKL